MLRINIRNRLLLVMGAILIFSFSGISYLNYRVTRASVHAEIVRNDLPLMMENIYSELTAELTRPLLVSSSMASDTFLKAWALEGERETEEIVKYLDQIRGKYGFFTSFFISAMSGNYYRYSGIHKKISTNDAHDVWYFNFLESKKEYDFDVDTDEAADNVLTIFINYRVDTAEGNFLGVAGVGLKVDTIAKLVGKYRQKFDRSVYLSDPAGIIQVHPDTALIGKKVGEEFEGLSKIVVRALGKTSDNRNYEFDRNGNRILLTVKYIPSLDWYLWVEQNETQALETARNNFIRTIVLGLVASVIIIAFTLVTINRYQERIEVLATIDELTGVANRRAFESGYQTIKYNYSRMGRPFSVLLIDLDNFKKVNDRFGHIAGDKFLMDITTLMSSLVRPSDVFARWGGDEFAIISESDLEGAIMVAERIRQSVERYDFTPPGTGTDDPRNKVTVSCGVALFRDGDDLDSLLLRADKAMYNCKENGGNSVEHLA